MNTFEVTLPLARPVGEGCPPSTKTHMATGKSSGSRSKVVQLVQRRTQNLTAQASLCNNKMRGEEKTMSKVHGGINMNILRGGIHQIFVGDDDLPPLTGPPPGGAEVGTAAPMDAMKSPKNLMRFKHVGSGYTELAAKNPGNKARKEMKKRRKGTEQMNI